MDSEGVSFEAKKPGRLLQQEEGLNLTGVMGMWQVQEILKR